MKATFRVVTEAFVTIDLTKGQTTEKDIAYQDMDVQEAIRTAKPFQERYLEFEMTQVETNAEYEQREKARKKLIEGLPF